MKRTSDDKPSITTSAYTAPSASLVWPSNVAPSSFLVVPIKTLSSFMSLSEWIGQHERTSSTVRTDDVGASDGFDLIASGVLQGQVDTGAVLLNGHRLCAKLDLNTELGEVLAEDPFGEILAHCDDALVCLQLVSRLATGVRAASFTSGRSGVMGGSSSIIHDATGSVPPGSLYLCIGGRGIPSR